MKKSNHELLYLFLSILLIGLAGFLYVTQGDRHIVPVAKTNRSAKKTVQSTTTSSSNPSEEELKAFLEQLTAAEAQPTLASLDQLKTSFENLKEGSEKTKVQERLAALEAEVNRIVSAEELVLVAENTLTQASFDQAQAAVSAITNLSSKENLQGRLNNVAARLATPVAPEPVQPVQPVQPAAPVAEEPVAPAVEETVVIVTEE